LHILGKMLDTIHEPRQELSRWAPRITTLHVKPEQIRIVIGSGGKTIKGITEQTGCSINIEDDGTVSIASADSDAVLKAVRIIEGLLEEPEVGRVYKGTVKRVVDFGAFGQVLGVRIDRAFTHSLAGTPIDPPWQALELPTRPASQQPRALPPRTLPVIG
jgi:polyribonucleotide nucleotidyltransferase